MIESKRLQRRTLLVSLAVIGLAPLAGCMTKPLRSVNADGTYCHRIGKSYRPKLTCTPTAVPTDAVEAEAKRFAASADRFTVYVVRKRWADAANVVKFHTACNALGMARAGQRRTVKGLSDTEAHALVDHLFAGDESF